MQSTEDYKIKYEEALGEIALLKAELQQLRKMIFGSKHERFIASENNPSQLTLNIQAEQRAECNIVEGLSAILLMQRKSAIQRSPQR